MPLLVDGTPTAYICCVDARFLHNTVNKSFNVTTQTPAAFTQHFGTIYFNAYHDAGCPGAPNHSTQPLTDLEPGIPCATIPAQATTSPPVPTPTELLRAGAPGSLYSFQTVFQGTLYVSDALRI